MTDRQLDAVSMHDMLLVRDMRRVICEVVATTGRPREDWRLEDVAEYVRDALTAAETRGRLAGLREAAGASDRANTWYCLAAIEGSLPAGVASGAIIASARIDVAIRKLIEETEGA